MIGPPFLAVGAFRRHDAARHEQPALVLAIPQRNARLGAMRVDGHGTVWCAVAIGIGENGDILALPGLSLVAAAPDVRRPAVQDQRIASHFIDDSVSGRARSGLEGFAPRYTAIRTAPKQIARVPECQHGPVRGDDDLRDALVGEEVFHFEEGCGVLGPVGKNP